MKCINNTASLLIFPFFAALFMLSACSDDTQKKEPESELEKKEKLLTSGTWIVQSVVVDGEDETDVYQGLALTFSEGTLSVTNGGAIWESGESWQFDDEAGSVVKLGDGRTFTIAEITSSQLVIDLTWTETTLGPGRKKSIEGRHRFTFKR